MRKNRRLGLTSFALAAALVLSPAVQAEEAVDPVLVEDEQETTKEEAPSKIDPPSEEEDEPVISLYEDVAVDHFAFDAIHYVTRMGLVSGTDEGLFNPDQSLTRAQAAKILTEALDLTTPTNYQLKATDVPANHWAVTYFKALEQQGIMVGNQGKLMPSAKVSRAQMATMLNRVFDYAAPTRFSAFNDIDRSFWAYYDINRLATNGVTTQENQAFRPNEATTRAQFVLFVARSMDDRFKN